MRSNPHRQRITAWLIIACIVGMLSSGLAHALAGPAPATPWQEICSLDGARQVGDHGRQDHVQAAHVAHCAFCSKYDHATALLSQVDITLPQRLREPSPTACVLPAPPSATPEWTHRPRGPPAHVAIR
ncbi:DUF2946 family protein [Herbaspirillum sp. YR522]|uniref:DUF2946 family protein n=1 Tax=Herbaspirillum sp. YR522 TaxID=1144342 RepID=UPI00026FCDE5|nr:DUF2946 family protein [Herbaspirillum sp. YR522]EJM95642.1 Protein of unknown function (DUF2946) [Herbaspirillum sp. YR522]